MLFNSFPFLFAFLPLTLAAFLALATRGRVRAALGALVGASLFYHAWPTPWHVGVLLGSIAVNFGLANALLRARASGAQRRATLLLILGISFDLSLIVGFKYLVFLADTAAAITGWEHGLQSAVLPLGISFFTFQQMAYLVDTWRGQAERCDLLHYLVFICFFPQLIAGPIVRHAQILPQLADERRWNLTSQGIAEGISLFSLGLFKKAVLADGVALYADRVFDGAATGQAAGFFEAWAGALAFTFQVYFDFSGYSDMAIGLGLLFGLKLPANFDSPYKSTSIIEFWRRWHMTLSAFLRDYLYIALGGNRRGEGRRYANLLITMLIGGLWHGAGWHFVLWGGLHGIFLLVNHAWETWAPTASTREHSSLRSWLARGGTFLVVVIAWVFFRGEDLGAIQLMLTSMSGFAGAGELPAPTLLVSLALLWILVWAAPNSDEWVRSFGGTTPTLRVPAWRLSRSTAIVLATILLTAILFLTRDFAHENAFIYYQF